MNFTPAPSIASENFSKAAESTLPFLKKAIGFDVWIITLNGNEEILILDADGNVQRQKKDAQLELIDRFCTHAVLGEGASIAIKPDEFSIYTKVDAFKNIHIGAYIATPIYTLDGMLFGSLCAINRTEKSETDRAHLPMVQTFAAVLGRLLDAEAKTSAQAALAEHAVTESIMDTITPLYNTRGWNLMIAIEESRAKQYAQALSIISIDLDGLKKINDTYGHAKGGEYISNAGKAIKDTIRPYDIASRTGGDEYNILLVDCDDIKAEKTAAAIRNAFDSYGIKASFGVAQLKYSETLAQTMERADQKMYEDKRAKKAKAAASAA